MTFEVEFKAWVDNPETLEARIQEFATFVEKQRKNDVYFRPAGTSGTGEHFRLRLTDNEAIVTTKFRRLIEGMETNDEIEFVVSDPHALVRWADRFGFEPFVVKRKTGRLYEAGRVRLELNEVEHLGTFLEVEILCEEEAEIEEARQELDSWRQRLGIDRGTIEHTPYIMLLQQRHPVRYELAHDDPQTLVREVPLNEAGTQDRLL